jgi:ribonuclease HII
MKNIKTKLPKNYYEKQAWANDRLVCGIDEVGRGCLAGPLVVGAVILPKNIYYPLLKDSKIMLAEERDKAFKWINKNCFWSIAIASNHIIDSRNIYQATLYAMRKAYLQLIETLPFSFEKLKYVLIDAMPLELDTIYRHKDLEFAHFPFGEKYSTSIAAASIVAKVTRDRLMAKMDPVFPAFSFQQHKGYGTKLHQSALMTSGPTIIHRTSFIDQLQEVPASNEQQSLF